MSAYIPKRYQQSVLDSVQAYFREVQATGNANSAFYNVNLTLWNRGSAYHPIDGFDTAMPYFCLRLPTGGGKTWLAAKSVALVNAGLLRSEFSVVLWLVPSNTIREQTLRALRDREHPYHAALREAGPVTVLSLDEAKSVTRATLESSTTVIVSTVQAFRRENTESLKVFDSNGALMSHFEHLDHAQLAELQRDENGAVVCSLANVLRLRRPFLIVDEAHNSRTSLSFSTFAGFRPSGIMELTATPDTEQTPSNVLHSVSAAELKTENMIKLPIRLETEGDWQKCLAYAIDCRDQLQAAADAERRQGASYLRPIVLIQAEARRMGVETRDVDAVKKALIENHNVPEDEIIIATGETRGLEAVEKEYKRGIADDHCPVKYVITQQALAEGWDCPSAYVLVSMAELRSSTAVEQLLGRILRQPQAKSRASALLNQSYAFVVSRDFGQTASALRDRLVDGAGFERHEVGDFVAARKDEQARLDLSARPGKVVVTPVSVALSVAPDLRSIPKPVRDKLAWDKKAGTLTITVPLTEDETAALQASVSEPEAKHAIEVAAAKCRAAVEMFQTPAERGEILSVPQMALRIQGELQLFDDPEVLDYPWELSPCDAMPTHAQLEVLDGNRVAEGGEIDIDTESGEVTTRFITELQRDLGLSYRPEHWDETRLATWLARNLPETAISHASKRAFVAHWLRQLLESRGFEIARVNRQKFLIRTLLETHVRQLRQTAVNQAYQAALLGDDAAGRVAVGDDYTFEFNPQGYAPSRDYDGRFGVFDFRKHYYGRIGDFDSKEEFACACKLDQWAQQGRMQFWVRNLVRKEGCSFFLQKANGRFYPDFLCKLNDGLILAVEYKGADRWAAAQDDRDIGELWANLSDGRCRFVMVRNREWEAIEVPEHREYAVGAMIAGVAGAGARAAEFASAAASGLPARPQESSDGLPGESATLLAAADPEDYASVRVFYATDRNRTQDSAPAKMFGTGRAQLTYGNCEVSVPRDHRMGELESPSVWRLEFRDNPAEHVVLLEVTPVEADVFFVDVAARVRESAKEDAFVFVHGYNVTFEDAARRTAQIAYDLGFGGAPTFFSWPSRGAKHAYIVDEQNIEWAQADLQDFLQEFLLHSQAECVYVIAHSMGNRALTRAVAALASKQPELCRRIKEVILAAPDIDAEVFRRDIAPALLATGNPVTLYASSRDLALAASKEIHGYARAGDSGRDLVIVPGMETIDATRVDTGFVGHSYFAEKRSVLSDMFHMIRDGQRAAKRFGLRAVGVGARQYWEFKP